MVLKNVLCWNGGTTVLFKRLTKVWVLSTYMPGIINCEKIFYKKLYVVLLHFDCYSLWVSLFNSVDYMYLLFVNWWFICFLLRSYSNGRTEYAAFSWRTCAWHIRGKPVPHSAHAGGWEYRHLYSIHNVSSALPLFTAPEQTLLLFSLSSIRALYCALSVTEVVWMVTRVHRHKAGADFEPRDEKRNVQITCICHDCVLHQYSGSYDSFNSIHNIP